MRVELINTGAELLEGLILNTHQAWICRILAENGYPVQRQVCVSDDEISIERAVQESMQRADLVITTGGLGPTADDRTRDRIAAMLGRKLVEDPAVRKNIESFFVNRSRPMPSQIMVQALIPAGAVVFQNLHGTAPGLCLQADVAGSPVTLVMLPGPPRELRPMFLDQVIPWLRSKFPPSASRAVRTLKIALMGESRVEELVTPVLKSFVDRGGEVAYCARVGEVDLRLTLVGEAAEREVERAACEAEKVLGRVVFGRDRDDLTAVLIAKLTARKETVALAESCTGGGISHRITNVPGASAVFLGSAVTYSNESKRALLGVKAETLEKHGAVSEQTAREMAQGALQKFGSTYSLAVTGIAGPGGGSDEKPVGTVYVGLATPESVVVEKYLNQYDRETFKSLTSQQALDLLRRHLLNTSEPSGQSRPPTR